jgi:hypothetical protein
MASPNEASIWSSSAPMDARNTPRSRYSSMQRPGLDRRLPRSLPLVSPLRAAPRAGCPEPSQAPVLPRSLPLVSPLRAAPRAGCPEPPQAPVLPRSLPLVSLLRAAPGAGCPEPSQAPVLPRSLPLVSPLRAAPGAGCPEPSQPPVLPRSLPFHACKCVYDAAALKTATKCPPKSYSSRRLSTLLECYRGFKRRPSC